MACLVNHEVGEIDEKKIRRVDCGIEEKKHVDDEPGNASDLRNRLPFAEIVGREIIGQGGHEARVAMAGNGERVLEARSFLFRTCTELISCVEVLRTGHKSDQHSG